MAEATLTFGGILSLRCLSILLFSACLCLRASAATSPSLLSVSPSICPSRTVNYITHGLLQQCLASTRPPATSSTDPVSSLTLDATSSAGETLITDGPQEQLSRSPAGAPPSVSPTAKSSHDIAESSDAAEFPDTLLSSSTVLEAAASSSPVGDEDDSGSLLNNADFLSFEDWKKQNLIKAGQSEHVGTGRQGQQREPGKRTQGVQHTLDSLDDDGEIDLDFTGFVADRPDLAVPSQPLKIGDDELATQQDHESNSPKTRSRSMDAGTTCKERFNYASFDCAATVLKTNPQAKGAHLVLLENKDSYMLNECSAENKFIILELCNDISIDTIVIANFEFFSSIFRTFRVSVSDKYPVKTDKWKTLGIFEARNSREIQAFLVENPLIWARYLRIEFLSHYGNEFFCPLSLVRVHGTTMMEEYKHDIESSMAEEDGEVETSDVVEAPEYEEALMPEALPEPMIGEERNEVQPAEVAARDLEAAQPVKFPTASNETADDLPSSHAHLSEHCVANATSRKAQPGELFFDVEMCHILTTPAMQDPSTIDHMKPNNTSLSSRNEAATPAPLAFRSTGSIRADTTTPIFFSFVNSTVESASYTAISTTTSATISSGSSVSGKTVNATASDKPKQTATSTQPVPAGPTLQESFFKSVQKRLQMLESNSSLSLQYIEEQSRALRDAFGKVEQRQLSKTTAFLEYLNTTVLNELRDFRQQYDQLWQSTVIELEIQREQYQMETLAINSRLSVLADEVIFQKRMSILQMILILVCLGLVLFSRGPMNNYMDIPIVQNMLARSPSARWMSVSALETPSTSPPATRPSSSGQMKHSILKRHARNQSQDSMNATVSHPDEYSPLTPVSHDGYPEAEDHTERLRPESPTFDPSTIERPSTSPPVLPSVDSPRTPDFVVLRNEERANERLVSPESSHAPYQAPPKFRLEQATPPMKHLTFQLPER